MTDRTTIRLTDERKRKIRRASDIVQADPSDDPPMSDVIDAALTHLVQSKENIDNGRGEYDPETIQALCNTDVLRLHYRTSLDSEWR